MVERAQRPIAGTVRPDIDASEQKRILALEIRLSKTGFAVLQGPTKLLDWGVGVRWFGRNNRSHKHAVSNRLRALMRLHGPSVVVARRINHYSAPANKRFAAILRSIRAECRRGPTEFKVIPTRRVQRHFALLGHSTRHEVATSLAERFEQLSWKLPRRKKSYQSEATGMLIFDAAATGATFFGGSAQQKGDVPAAS
jgi:hypothetical protein